MTTMLAVLLLTWCMAAVVQTLQQHWEEKEQAGSWKEDTGVRDLFSCSSLSEGGCVNLRTTVEFSHLCTDM